MYSYVLLMTVGGTDRNMMNLLEINNKEYLNLVGCNKENQAYFTFATAVFGDTHKLLYPVTYCKFNNTRSFSITSCYRLFSRVLESGLN